ncbi:protoporphyrinogen oxidase HemJ [Candidatus Pelagibacter sp.]|nr:protoporphyrinogen oxidase HemJ [Candidatus Pelagibacter sp.]
MNTYLLFKSLHLISVISWMAGLLYLPRIFVYHAENIDQKEVSKIFKIMERRLFNYIMMPAMILSWVFGILLIGNQGVHVFYEFWVVSKGALVLLLTYYHFYLGKCVRLFATDQNTRPSKFFRIINEVPTILLILIVFIVVFKPL